MEFTSQQLLSLVRCDDQAAAELYDKYVDRLIALARSRMSAKLQRREDAEDIVQSVYRCFFDNAKQGAYQLQRSGDLWRLLAAITIKKTIDHARFHGMQKRAMTQDVPLTGMGYLSTQPTPDQAAALEDELAGVLSRQSTLQRRILELRLQGLSTPEIAAAVERSERTVRRTLEQLMSELSERLMGD